MKEIFLPLSSPTIVSAAVSRFGLTVNILQSDTDSDSSYSNPEFIISSSVNRDDLGLCLRTGDKLVLVNGKPTHEMWSLEVDFLRLSFDEKRKKRRPKSENVIPKVVCTITETTAEKHETVYLRPSSERSQKISKSSGAVYTLSDVIEKLNYTSREKILGTTSNAPVVTTMRHKEQTFYCCSKKRNKQMFCIWASVTHFIKADCIALTNQITSLLCFLYDSYSPGDDPTILNKIIDGLNMEPKSTLNYSTPGTIQWKYALRDYSHTIPICLSADIDSALSEIDAIEFDSILQTPNQIYPRRKYFVIGTAVYYRNLLVGSHASTEDQKLLSALQSALTLLDNETFFQEVHPPSRMNHGQIVGYEQPENASYCVIMVQYSSQSPVTVTALLETFIPTEQVSESINVDPMMIRRCRQVAKILSKNEKLRIWFETPEFIIAEEGSKPKKLFPRNPFNRNKQDAETGSLQSGSTTASFLAPVNVGEQFQNVSTDLVEITSKDTSLEFYACFITNGVILLPRSNYPPNRAGFIRRVQEKIAIMQPQLETEQEVGVLIPDGHRKGSGNVSYWVVGRRHEERDLFVCFEEKIPQNMNEIVLKFSFGLLTKH